MFWNRIIISGCSQRYSTYARFVLSDLRVTFTIHCHWDYLWHEICSIAVTFMANTDTIMCICTSHVSISVFPYCLCLILSNQAWWYVSDNGNEMVLRFTCNLSLYLTWWWIIYFEICNTCWEYEGVLDWWYVILIAVEVYWILQLVTSFYAISYTFMKYDSVNYHASCCNVNLCSRSQQKKLPERIALVMNIFM